MTAVMEIASIKRRFCAYLIDVAILLILNLLIILLLKNFPLILDLSYMCVNCSYFTYFISSAVQATPGQQLMNIHTISLDGSKIDLSLAFDRSISQFFLYLLKNVILILVGLFQEQDALVSVFNILVVVMVVVIEQLLFLCWYLVACFSQKKQTYHDMLFDTIVVKGTIK
ncbi:RDD family protein [Wolbachia endosymbiont of Madathamugadia hiepei]|uniref:RDD family protein n=1 Tax=Wolbachia endosymbiont of Madathamugadia hiepei TaxID=1241303 RepID=UPI001589C0F6|nr:RDD family protein [Wolbachia endosymbiont of Madathamugadia hiepei]NUX01226.1 RDD family protein [Wolbachia endosymbiont of Madathamugadia hiepei]